MRTHELRLFNSMGRRVESFAPSDPAHVRMYVCGPTVYSYAHKAARQAYEDWWQALGWVREGLIGGYLLRELEVTAAMPRVKPWKR